MLLKGDCKDEETTKTNFDSSKIKMEATKIFCFTKERTYLLIYLIINGGVDFITIFLQ